MTLWLPEATTTAPEVDYLILAMLLISCAVLALVFGLMLLYVIKYRAGSGIDRGALAKKTWRLETSWTVATLIAFFGLFIWGADLYLRLFQPPPDAMKIYVIGKQWMWKIEHPGGQSEINALHLPIGRPIELVMTSEDVIHDFSVPGIPDQARCAAGAIQVAVVQGRQTRHLSSVLYPALRHRPRANDRRNRGDDRARIPEMAAAEWRRRDIGRGGKDIIHAQRLQWLPRRQRHRRQSGWQHGARSGARRPLRQRCDAGGRHRGHRRRSLHPRLHSVARNPTRRRLSARDAEFLPDRSTRTISSRSSPTSSR